MISHDHIKCWVWISVWWEKKGENCVHEEYVSGKTRAREIFSKWSKSHKSMSRSHFTPKPRKERENKLYLKMKLSCCLEEKCDLDMSNTHTHTHTHTNTMWIFTIIDVGNLSSVHSLLFLLFLFFRFLSCQFGSTNLLLCFFPFLVLFHRLL